MTDSKMCRILDGDEARRLDSRIRLLSKAAADNLTKLVDLIAQAKQAELHKALGYPSWTKYLASALAEANIAVGSKRGDIVALLADEGMSNRAIAQAVGVTETTVRRDKIAVVRDEGPSLDDVAEGRQVRHDVAPRSPKLKDRREFFAAERVPANVIGLDGKTYRPPVKTDADSTDSIDQLVDSQLAKKKPRPRRPLASAFNEQIRKMYLVTNSLANIAQDDRFRRHADLLRRRHRADLVRTRDILNVLIAQLDAELKRPVIEAVTDD